MPISGGTIPGAKSSLESIGISRLSAGYNYQLCKIFDLATSHRNSDSKDRPGICIRFKLAVVNDQLLMIFFKALMSQDAERMISCYKPNRTQSWATGTALQY